MMEIEIFLDKQLADITFEVEAQEEWTKIAEELGLSSQLDLKKGKDSPIPYPWMNTCMERVFSTLCPEKVELSKYNKTPIPLEIMKQLSFTINDRHFAKIEVWYDDKSPDPAIIGLHGYWYVYGKDMKGYDHAENESGQDIEFLSQVDADKYKVDNNFACSSFCEKGKYLIAKWGDVKREFSGLKDIAIERFIDQYSSTLKTDIATLEQKLKSIKDNAKLYMSGDISLGKATTKDNW